MEYLSKCAEFAPLPSQCCCVAFSTWMRQQSVSCRLELSWSRVELSATCYRTCETAGTLQIQVQRSGRSVDPAYVAVQVRWRGATLPSDCRCWWVGAECLFYVPVGAGGGRIGQTRQRLHSQHRRSHPVWPRCGGKHGSLPAQTSVVRNLWSSSQGTTSPRKQCCKNQPIRKLQILTAGSSWSLIGQSPHIWTLERVCLESPFNA